MKGKESSVKDMVKVVVDPCMMKSFWEKVVTSLDSQQYGREGLSLVVVVNVKGRESRQRLLITVTHSLLIY